MRLVLAIFLGLVTAIPAAAQQGSAAPPAAAPDLAEGGRYDLQSVQEGVLRVDRQTGTTSICRQRGAQWSCEAVPDEREALEAEIGRLADENAQLRQRLAALEKETQPGKRDDGRPAIELPSKKDLDQVVGFFQDVMRRVYDLVQDLRREFQREGGG